MFTLYARARLTAALVLITTLLVSALGPPAPVAAQSLESARVQLVVKQVHVHDDREGAFSGKGEMKLLVSIWRCPGWVPLPCLGENLDAVGWSIARGFTHFSAGSDETVTLDHVVPQAGDLMFHPDTSPENGIAVYDGYNYLVRFDMHESDGGWSNIEPMGWVLHVLNTGEQGLGLGTHTARSVLANRTGDYTITYEIRPSPLPDLQALHQITIDDLPGSAKKRVCMVVHNRGGAPAGPFEVALRVDHVVPPDGRTTAAGLAPGTNYTACVETALPTPGQHLLAAVVDAPRAVTELNETNNSYEQLYAAASASSSTAPAPSPQPAPATGQAQSDLTVSAIRVRGQVPDGKDDCKDGGNDVAVVVKNSGSEKAGGFAVRLTVDGAQGDGSEQTVNGLEAGKEREVTFENVKLKKGEHTLKALADAKGAVTETNEENNDREVTARCKDEN